MGPFRCLSAHEQLLPYDGKEEMRCMYREMSLVSIIMDK